MDDSATGLIEIRDLTKRFGSFVAVDNLSFDVQPGRVTGFLGPNGAGKTTTLRMLLGLVHPSAGSATIGGSRYVDLPRPLGRVGAALEATSFHPGRSGRNHLRVLADAASIPVARADELLELTGLGEAADKHIGLYSMGMRQRLGLASAMIGDPSVLILDEPANGLDPEGIRWLRGFLRHQSAQGKTVLVSSHLLPEVEQTVDDVVIIAKGRLVRSGSIAELRGTPGSIVRTSDARALAQALSGAGIPCESVGSPLSEPAVGSSAPQGQALIALSTDQVRIGEVALRAGLPIYGLAPRSADLEELFLQVTMGQGPASQGMPQQSTGGSR